MTFFIAAIAQRFSAVKASVQAAKEALLQIRIQSKQAGHDFKITTCLFNSKKMMRCFAVILLSTSVKASTLRRHEESIRSFAYFVDFIAQSEKILKGLRFLSRIAQQ